MFNKFEENERAGEEELMSVMRKNEDRLKRFRALSLLLILNNFAPQLRSFTFQFVNKLIKVIILMSNDSQSERHLIPG